MRFLKWLRDEVARWLIPGMGVKRWLVVLLVGAVLLGLGMSAVLLEVFGAFSLSFGWTMLIAVAGGTTMVFAVARLNRALLQPFVRPGQSVSQAVSDYRRRGRGPKIVALGGGTGLSTLLRGLKAHTPNLTAIVTVADDGGSSGRLRQTLGVLPPGDFRNCIAALADDEALTTQLFQYRFGEQDQDLGGHAFGNLFITAMAAVSGSFERGLMESSHVLNIRGQVLPSTLRNVTLVGELEGEAHTVNVVEGKSAIAKTPGAIRRVYLRPNDAGAEPQAYPPVIRAILEAELIVLGPGSLYTSLLPNLLVPDLVEAIRASQALKVYVCNTATQPGETDDYSAWDHLHAIEAHTASNLFPTMLVNNNQRGQLLPGLQWVSVTTSTRQIFAADLIDDEHPWRHDSLKLAKVLMGLLNIETAG